MLESANQALLAPVVVEMVEVPEFSFKVTRERNSLRR